MLGELGNAWFFQRLFERFSPLHLSAERRAPNKRDRIHQKPVDSSDIDVATDVLVICLVLFPVQCPRRARPRMHAVARGVPCVNHIFSVSGV